LKRDFRLAGIGTLLPTVTQIKAAACRLLLDISTVLLVRALIPEFARVSLAIIQVALKSKKRPSTNSLR